MPSNEAFQTLGELEAWLELMSRTPSDEAPGLTELDHGLQCAAELRSACPNDIELQLAGLLHDIGHGRASVDDHARTAAAALRGLVGERVAELVGLHIDAKRYLVTTDPDYRGKLTPVSVRSLAIQGGDMTLEERVRFEGLPTWREALRLRRADEAAKTPGRDVPGLDAWLPALRDIARRRVAA